MGKLAKSFSRTQQVLHVISPALGNSMDRAHQERHGKGRHWHSLAANHSPFAHAQNSLSAPISFWF
jgi:hypothetical protein